MEKTNLPRSSEVEYDDQMDRPLHKMSLVDIEVITGLKIKEVRENAKFLTALLENGVQFSIPKW